MTNRTYIVFGLMIAFLGAVGAGAAIDTSGCGSSHRVLYDDTHGQTAGNADWVLHGAYSEMADMWGSEGFSVVNLSSQHTNGRFTAELLSTFCAVVLAEPNKPYAQTEIQALIEFVRQGGGLFLIANHHGADRNNDGWDAVRIFNTFIPRFGFRFNHDTFYEAPLSGEMNPRHPVMRGVRAVGAWAGGTMALATETAFPDQGKAVNLIGSRVRRASYVVAAEYGKGRVVCIGDSAPFNDGVGSGDGGKLHDSYDSFMFSHPQLAYNALKWVCGETPIKRIPSRDVAMHHEADPNHRAINVLIDAAHGNAAADKMQTFERHAVKLGFKVYYTLNLITPQMLSRFSFLIIPSPSMRITTAEADAISHWLMGGGRLLLSGEWDSSKLDGRDSLNFLLTRLGSVMRLNSDQVWDHTNKTRKPWGVVAHTFKQGHPVVAGVKRVITWGTCSLITRDRQPLSEEAGVEILVTGDHDSLNKDGDQKNDAMLFPKGTPIPLFAIERLAHGILAVSGSTNFTDYQYPDSDINKSLPTPPPVVHETPLFYNQLLLHMKHDEQKIR